MDDQDVIGDYRHFKGGRYRVLGIARHSETEEELVVYATATGQWWVRPKDMFFSDAIVEGKAVARFTRL